MKAFKLTATAIALSLAAAGAFGAEKSSASRTITNTGEHDLKVIQRAPEFHHIVEGGTVTISETLVRPGESRTFERPVFAVYEMIRGGASSQYRSLRTVAAQGDSATAGGNAGRRVHNTGQHDVRVIQPAAELTYILDGPTLTITETIVKPGENHVFDGPVLSVRELVPGPQSDRYLQGD
jgi:hypothetical protein